MNIATAPTTQSKRPAARTEQTALFGFDPGNNAHKFARVQGGEITTYMIPATVGLDKHNRKDGLSLGGVVQQTRRASRQPFRVVFDGMEYLVGPNVDQYTKPIDQLDLQKRYTESDEVRAAFYAGAAQLLNGGPHRAAIAMALPVKLLEDKNEAARIEQGVKNWMVGEHIFSVDGVETSLNIVNVRCKIMQPVATWFDWGMNMRCEWIKGREARLAPTLVADQGFNTLDVAVVENGRISDRLSGGDTLGMSRAAEELIETVGGKYDVSVELYRANELIKDYINGRKVEIYVHGKLTDITSIARSCVNSLEADVDNYFTRSLGKTAGRYNVLLTGGGIIGLRESLLRRFPKATVMYDPVLANARGLAKAAVRTDFLVEQDLLDHLYAAGAL